MKSVSLILVSLVLAFSFSACGTCPKSQKMKSGCCASADCPPSKSCPAGSAHCKVKKAS